MQEQGIVAWLITVVPLVVLAWLLSDLFFKFATRDHKKDEP